MPMGDSITQGDTAYNSYRRPLWKLLEKGGVAADFVGSMRRNHGGWPPVDDFDQQHEGHWGWRVDEVLESCEAWVKKAKPDVVLLQIGTNDLYQGQPVEETVDEMEMLLKRILVTNADTKILLGAVLPADMTEVSSPRAPEDLNDRIAAFNAQLQALTLDHTLLRGRVRWVPLDRGFKPVLHTHDGIHPNEAGEDVLARKWYEALMAMRAS
jgi:lysophospholipase L1-like esterase